MSVACAANGFCLMNIYVHHHFYCFGNVQYEGEMKLSTLINLSPLKFVSIHILLLMCLVCNVPHEVCLLGLV